MPFLPITEPVMTALRTPHRTINLVIVSSCDRGGCVRALGSSLPHRLPPPRGVYLTLYTCGICLAVPIPILASRRFDNALSLSHVPLKGKPVTQPTGKGR